MPADKNFTRNKLDPDFLRILNTNLSENPTWRTLMEKVTTVVNDLVTSQTTELARIRDVQHVHRGDYYTTDLGRGRVVHVDRKYDPTNVMLDEVSVNVDGLGNVVIPIRTVHQRDILINSARFMGFDYFSDSLTDEDYARIARYVGEYWDDSAGDKFVKFMGFIKNTRFEIDQLWTRDAGDYATSDDVELRKYPFLEPNYGFYHPVYGSNTAPNLTAQSGNNNTDYPTAHVQLNYDLSFTDGPMSEKDMEDVICLFYFLAPIHLVLERVNAAANVEFYAYSNKGRNPQIHHYGQGPYKWEATIEKKLTFGYTQQVHAYQQSYLHLNATFEQAP